MLFSRKDARDAVLNNYRMIFSCLRTPPNPLEGGTSDTQAIAASSRCDFPGTTKARARNPEDENGFIQMFLMPFLIRLQWLRDPSLRCAPVRMTGVDRRIEEEKRERRSRSLFSYPTILTGLVILSPNAPRARRKMR